MMRTIKLPVMAILLGAGISLASAALAADHYFEALYDVPVMKGLEEVKGEAVLFDKPDGRIASVMAVSKDIAPAAVNAFYAGSLPQLGWQKTAENQYVRGKEQLTLEVSSKPPLTVVHFTLSPLKP